ncbi:MAG TPA: hypothetical protein VF519_03355 [Mycobacteriales bacterium]|jgi:hypothetical protein
MRHTTTLAAVVLAALAGCGGADPAPSPAPAASVSATQAPWLAAVHAGDAGPDYAAADDGSLTDLADAACELLDAGGDPMGEMLKNYPGEPTDAAAGHIGAFLGLAVAGRCPDHTADL